MTVAGTSEAKRFDFWLATAWTMYFAWGVGWICYLSYRTLKGIP